MSLLLAAARFPLATTIAAVLPSHIEASGHSVLRSSIDAPREFGLTICAMNLDFCKFPRLTGCITPQMRAFRLFRLLGFFPPREEITFPIATASDFLGPTFSATSCGDDCSVVMSSCSSHCCTRGWSVV